MSVRDEQVSFSLEVNVQDAYKEARRLQTVLFRSLSLVRRLSGGNEGLDNLIRTMQRAITIANSLRLALRALQLARMSTGDPIAWALAGLSVAEVGINIGEATREDLFSKGPQ